MIVYHEQVLKTLAVMGGYDLSEADRIRAHLDDDPDRVDELPATSSNGRSGVA